MTITVGFLAFPQMEMLDYSGPHQVFTTASKLMTETSTDKEIHLITIAESLDPIEVQGGAHLCPQATIDDHLELSCLIIPGGKTGVDMAIEGGRVVPWIETQAGSTPILASVSTGAFLLAQTGLLNGLEATTHHAHVEDLRRRFPAIDVVEGTRWVESGRFLTSAGVTDGIAMAVHLVERMVSPDLARVTAERLAPSYGVIHQ